MSAGTTPVSPFSTGGGGTRFELLTAASYVVSMLRREFARGLDANLIMSVNLQQRNRGYLVDDIVVVAQESTATRKLALQAKHQLRFTDNTLFEEVLRDCWSHFSRVGFDRTRDRIGVAISEVSNIQDVKWVLQTVLNVARMSADANAFMESIREFKNQLDCITLFRTVLNRVAATTLSDDTVWQFLCVFQVIAFDFDNAGSRDSWICWNSLLTLLPLSQADRAYDLFGVLYSVVSEFAKTGGEITLDTLRQRLSDPLYRKLTFRTRSDLTTIMGRMKTQVTQQLQRERNSKKYIPAVFVESTIAKDSARQFCLPALFVDKLLDDLRCLDLSVLNRLLPMLSLPAFEVPSVGVAGCAHDICDLQAECATIRSLLEKAKTDLASFVIARHADPDSRVPAEKRYVWKDVGYPLETAAHVVTRYLDELLDDLAMITSDVFLIVSRAGQGKTNFVCDFVETVLLPRDIPCIFFTGRELKAVSPSDLPRAIVQHLVDQPGEHCLTEVLIEMDAVCRRANAPLTVIIDGLNEHSNIPAFAKAVERLVESLLPSGLVRVILTCREEYFDRRFNNLITASFASRTRTIRELHRSISEQGKRRMVAGYFDFFKIACPHMSETVAKKLENDPLLLRLFCEAYGDHHASRVAALPPQIDIYKDTLFCTYLSSKLDKLTERDREERGATLGVANRFKRVLKCLVDRMVEKRLFVDFPVGEVPEADHRTLDDLLDEDVIVRRDLVAGRTVLDEGCEVINFTFDEFRDFLIADYVAADISPANAAHWQSVMNDLVVTSSPVAEGLSRYLFYASKRPEAGCLASFVDNQDWFGEVFLECIFSIEDSYVSDKDRERIRQRYSESVATAERITWPLLYRWQVEDYPKLNIELLFSIWDELTPDEFTRLVRPCFEAQPHAIKPGNTPFPVEKLAQQLRDALCRPGRRRSASDERLVELLVYVSDCRDRYYTYPARDALRSIIQQVPDVGYEGLRAHLSRGPRRNRASVFDLLSDIAKGGGEIPADLVTTAVSCASTPDRQADDHGRVEVTAAEFLLVLAGRSGATADIPSELVKACKAIIRKQRRRPRS
jgi:hypothetical protein